MCNKILRKESHRYWYIRFCQRPTDSASLKSEVDKWDVDGLEIVAIMFIVMLLKRLDMMNQLKKVSIHAINTSKLVTEIDYGTILKISKKKFLIMINILLVLNLISFPEQYMVMDFNKQI